MCPVVVLGANFYDAIGTMAATLFDKPQKVVCVDTSSGCYGTFIYFETLCVQLVRLIDVLHKASAACAYKPKSSTCEPTTQCSTSIAYDHSRGVLVVRKVCHRHASMNELCLINETLLPQHVASKHKDSSAPPVPISCKAPSPPKAAASQQLITKVFKGASPTDEDFSTARSFYWAEVPWKLANYDFTILPKLEEELFAFKTLAAAGVAPASGEVES